MIPAFLWIHKTREYKIQNCLLTVILILSKVEKVEKFPLIFNINEACALEPSGRERLLLELREAFNSRRSVGSGSDFTIEMSESDCVGEECGNWEDAEE